MTRGTTHIRLTNENYEKVRTLAYMRNDSIAATVNAIVEEYVTSSLTPVETTSMWTILNEKTKMLREDSDNG